MNLQKLFTAQAELDAYIEQQHPTLPGENRLEKKVLALLVKLGECANEWRGFKFWSNDQKPSVFVPNPKDVCVKCNGEGMLDKEKEFIKRRFCDECDGCGNHYHNPLLEEYVDCLHFILSIGNDVKFNYTNGIAKSLHFSPYTHMTVEGVFTLVFAEVMKFHKELSKAFMPRIQYAYMLQSLLVLGATLGFTFEQIEEAYWAKYEINKQRQVEGY